MATMESAWNSPKDEETSKFYVKRYLHGRSHATGEEKIRERKIREKRKKPVKRT
jgi:hypothetical protein